MVKRENEVFVSRENIYEKLCNFSYSLLRFKFDENFIEKERRIINFCNLNIPPTSNISAAFTIFVVFFVFSFLLAFPFGFSYFFYFLILSIFFSFLVYYYPYILMRYIRITSSSEMLLSVIYMVISLYRTPNLENAVVFAYKNLKGPLKKDFEMIIRDFNLRKIFTFEEGLKRIIEKWSFEAKEFSESLKLLIEYSRNPYGGEKMLEESIRLVVEESYAKMTRYARELKLPTTAILVLGVILPVIGLTLIPLLTIFLPEILNISAVFFVYDFFLPLLLFSLILMLVESRPLTASSIRIESNPIYINFLGRKLNIFIVSFLIFLPIFLFLVSKIFSDVRTYYACIEWGKAGFEISKKPIPNISMEECKFYMSDLIYQSISPSILLFLFVLFTLLPLYLRNKKYVEKRKRIKDVESELGTLLFQLSHRVSVGVPIEEAVFTLGEKAKTMEVESLIKDLKRNVSVSGSLKYAIFGENGVIRKYNSTIISSVFEIIVEISAKGSLYLSKALSTFSRYLKNLSDLQEKIEDLISDNVSTMKFMAYFLIPLVGGVSVSIGLIILGILGNLSIVMSQTLPKEAGGIPSISLPLINLWGASPVSPSLFQLAIGIYVLELCLISSFFIVGLEEG
ncbi:MAG: hypothetical protein ACP5JK_02810, partial [Candidatus Aenigmatarchaeota archaeon]